MALLTPCEWISAGRLRLVIGVVIARERRFPSRSRRRSTLTRRHYLLGALLRDRTMLSSHGILHVLVELLWVHPGVASRCGR